ncbi:MAG: hypothetical protein MRY74_15380 [Neomegalonema sp.]|nr:hypothetical protein [Neomegalonema sp.]
MTPVLAPKLNTPQRAETPQRHVFEGAPVGPPKHGAALDALRRLAVRSRLHAQEHTTAGDADQMRQAARRLFAGLAASSRRAVILHPRGAKPSFDETLLLTTLKALKEADLDAAHSRLAFRAKRADVRALLRDALILISVAPALTAHGESSERMEIEHGEHGHKDRTKRSS